MSNKGKRYEIAILIPCTLDLSAASADLAIMLKFKISDTQYSPIIQGLIVPVHPRPDSLSMLALEN